MINKFICTNPYATKALFDSAPNHLITQPTYVSLLGSGVFQCGREIVLQYHGVQTCWYRTLY